MPCKNWRRSLSKLSKFIWFQIKLRRFFTAWWIKGGQIKLLLVIVGTKHFLENVHFFFFGSPTCFALWKSLKTKGAWCQTKSPMLANRPHFTEDGHFWLTDCRIVVTFSLGILQWQRSPLPCVLSDTTCHGTEVTHTRGALAAGRRWPNFGQPFSLCLAESCFNGMALRLFPETEVQVPKHVTCSFSMIHISPPPIIFSSGYLLFSF